MLGLGMTGNWTVKILPFGEEDGYFGYIFRYYGSGFTSTVEPPK